MNIRKLIIGLMSVSALGAFVATTSHSEATSCGPQAWNVPLFCGPAGVSSVNFEAKSRGLLNPDRIEATLGNQTAAITRARATGRTSGGVFCCAAEDKTKNGINNGVSVSCPPLPGQCPLPSQHIVVSS